MIRTLTVITCLIAATTWAQHEHECAPSPEPVVDLTRQYGEASDSGDIFDVMVVYTPAAEAHHGDIDSLIAASIDSTNTAFENSGVIPRLRLVHTHEVDYAESSFVSDLSRLESPGDGYMDEVLDLRDQYGADLVAMLRKPGEYCGIANTMRFLHRSWEQFAFSVTSVSCAVGNITFAHELGHNMGCQHAIPEAQPGTGVFDYSHGYRWGGYRSVMAYSPGVRVKHFSNPDVLHDGLPTGSGLANNARSINEAAHTIANFRQSVVEPPPPPAALNVEPVDDVESSGPVGGPFAPISQSYKLVNSSDQDVKVTIADNKKWLFTSARKLTVPANTYRYIVARLYGNKTRGYKGIYGLRAGVHVVEIEFKDTTNGISVIRHFNLTVTE